MPFSPIFFVVVVLIILGLWHWRNYYSASFSFSFLLMALMAKILMGCLFGYFFSTVAYQADTWMYHKQSIVEYNWLKQDAFAFFKDIFIDGYSKPTQQTFFDSSNSYWKDLSNNLLVKLLACFNLATSGYYYYNVVLFSCISILGPVFLYKLLSIYTKPLLILKWFIFFFPPLLFWTSGIHKDGVLFALLTICWYCIYKGLHKKKATYILPFAISFVLLFLFRSYSAFTVLPFAIALVVNHYIKLSTQKMVVISLVFSIFLFGASALLPNAFNLPLKLAERQQSFLSLSGGSQITTSKLLPTLDGYWDYLNIAFKSVLIQPNFSNAIGKVQWLSVASNILFIAIAILYIIVATTKKAIPMPPYWLLVLPFAILSYLIIGYTVPFSGAIVRYKVIAESCFILFFLERIFNYLQPFKNMPKPK